MVPLWLVFAWPPFTVRGYYTDESLNKYNYSLSDVLRAESHAPSLYIHRKDNSIHSLVVTMWVQIERSQSSLLWKISAHSLIWMTDTYVQIGRSLSGCFSICSLLDLLSRAQRHQIWNVLWLTQKTWCTAGFTIDLTINIICLYRVML